MWKKLSKEGKALVIVIASAVLLMLVFSFVPMMRVSYEVEGNFLATETYYTLESYTVEEEYTVMEPYMAVEALCDEEPCTEYIPIDYVVISGQGYNYFQFDGSPVCSGELLIQNLDIIGGTFTAEFLITIQGGLTTTISGSQYIEAGGTKKVVAYYSAPLKTLTSFSYSVTASEKLDPSYREEEVTRYREATEYGEVTKDGYFPVELTVLKTETVTAYKRVSLLNYLINY